MNQQFAAYVQGVAFQITLSRSMVLALSRLASGDPDPFGSHFIKITRSLERRGLIEPMPEPRQRPFWRLTRAGALTVELLREAGMIEAASNLGEGRAA